MMSKVGSRLRDGLRALTEARVGQISALDGLRAMAITLVIAGKSQNDFFFAAGPQTPHWFFSTIGFGWIGVDLFFVLSGFLIGRILFQEIRATGKLEVGSFLLKRGLRIWPLYFFICGLGLVQMISNHRWEGIASIIPDLTFTTNFFSEKLAFGSWSLSIEEQFYLLTSIALFFALKRVKNLRKIFPLLGFLLLLAPLFRNLTWQYYLGHGVDPFYLEWEIVHSYFFTHYEGLVVGVAFAAATVLLPKTAKLRSNFSLLLIAGIILTSIGVAFERLMFLYSLISLAFGLAVWHCLQRPKSTVARFFSWPAFGVISRLSYGMYLWYRFPLWRIADFVSSHFSAWPSEIRFVLIFGIDFTLAAAAATVTFLIVERPFLQLRSRIFAPARTERIQDGRLDYT